MLYGLPWAYQNTIKMASWIIIGYRFVPMYGIRNFFYDNSKWEALYLPKKRFDGADGEF